MTIKAILAELKEAQEDPKAIERLAETTDTEQARRKVRFRLKSLVDSLSLKGFEFDACEAAGGKKVN